MARGYSWFSAGPALAGLLLAARGWAASASGTAGTASGPLPASMALTGRVHRLGSPDPIPGAQVRVLGRAGMAVADGRGAYRLSLPSGRWTLSACAYGYHCLTRTVRLELGHPRRLNLGLEPAPVQGSTVTIRAHREAPQPVEASVSQAEIKEIPGSFGDALRAVQVLPGVAVPSDLSGQLLIQGGGPDDNLYWVDSIPWPIPFHFGGLDSTIDPELLESVDLYGAGYGARWGGALAAVLDGQTQAPPTDRLHVEADLSLLEASGSLSGPLGVGDATFALTARRSYFDLAGGLVGYSDLPTYWDSQAVVDFHLGPNNRFHILAMGSDDSFNANLGGSGGLKASSGGQPITGSLEYGNGFESGGLSWTNTSVKGLVSTLTPYLYNTQQILGFAPLADDSTQGTYGLKEEAVWDAGSWLGLGHEVSAGGDVERTNYAFSGSLPRITYTASSFADLTSLPEVASSVASNGWDGYAYVQDRARLNRFWALTLGLHYDTSTLVADGEVGPRVGLEFKPTPRDTWTAAWGLYDQAPTPLQVNPQYGNPGLEPESAQHTVLSYEHDFPDSVTFKSDAYYKALSDLIVSDPSNPDLYDNKGQGDVKGLDLSLKQDLGADFFWALSGSLSDSDRLDLPDEPWTLYEYDQPQIFNAVVSWRPVPRWTLGAKLRYNSGDLVLPEGATLYTEADRLPYYLRIDLRAERTWLFQVWTLKAYFEILNVLNRDNGEAAAASSGQTEEVPDLPRLPNVGLEADY